MPDINGNFTKQEIEVLKAEKQRLLDLDQSFKNLSAIGQDVTEDRKERDKEVAEINLILRVYEPLVKD